jgi:copper homeostasis protein
MVLLEVCVDSLDAALTARDRGADRVELCVALAEGGLTPSHGLLISVCRALQGSPCKVHVLIRPRAGDFLYTDAEVEVSVDWLTTDPQSKLHILEFWLQIMRLEVLHAAANGAAGVVLGFLTSQARVDSLRLVPFVALCAHLGARLGNLNASPACIN